ncbi:MAG: NEAT domain-containing protein, partial [Clostridiales Family XIII bacterium]|nr:NEAT domain-containing protein [Clostridiales Family XIII bacterium]
MKRFALPKRCLSLLLVMAMVLGGAPAWVMADGGELAVEFAPQSSYIYATNEQAAINVTTSPSAVIYYTIDGNNPTTNSSQAAITSGNGIIYVPAPEDPDGGGVTLKAFAKDGDDSSSEIQSINLSFYRTNQEINDAMSLTAGSGTYYFATAETAFNAVDDPNVTGDVTLKVVRTDVTYTVASGSTNTTVQMFSGATGAVTLDLNGMALKLNMDGTAYATVNLNASNFTITDSTATGTATDTDGKERAGTDINKLTSGTLTLENAMLRLIDKEEIIVENVNIAVIGSKPRQAVNGTDTAFEIDNVRIIRESISGDALALFQFAGVGGSVSHSVIKNARGSGIVAAANVSLINNTVIVSSSTTSHYPLDVSPLGTATVQSGMYKGPLNAIRCQLGATAYLEGGIFDGNLYANGNNSKIILHAGYHKGAMTFTGTGYAAAEHCTATPITDGDYDGYTIYTPRALHASAVSVVDEGGQNSAAATLSASVDGVVQPNLANVYEGEEIIYTLVVMPGYRIMGIDYTPNGETKQSIDLTGNPNYTVNDRIAKYTMTVPDKDYALKFTLQNEDTQGEDTAQIGDVTYKSLSAAVAELQENQTLKLLRDITYTAALELNKTGTTLDLNGQTLTMNVPSQSNIMSENYSILLSGGDLTVTDGSQETTGALSFGGGTGIRLTGTNTAFTLQSGTIKDLTNDSFCYSIDCLAKNGSVNIDGGRIFGRIIMNERSSVLNFTGGELEATHTSTGINNYNGGTVNITGGRIHSGSDMVSLGRGLISVSGISNGADAITLNIAGNASIFSEDKVPAVSVDALYSNGRVLIGGNAQIVNAGGAAALQLNGAGRLHTVSSSVAVDGNAKLRGSTYAIEFTESGDKKDDGTSLMTPIEITGGYFAGGEGYIPVSDTYYTTYPDDYVLDTETSGQPGFEGYYTLATKESLGGSYTFSGVEYPYTYQDYEGISDGSNSGLADLLEDAALIYAAGAAGHIGQAWSAFVSAYDMAERVKEINRNANQSEIDFRSANLVRAMQALENTSGLDVDNLADGTYSIGVQMWKANMTALSMSNSAFESPAALTVKDGKARLSINLGPAYQYFLWGHLENFYMWKGSTFAEAKANANLSTVIDENLLNEAVYSNFYYHDNFAAASEEGRKVTYRKDAEGEDAYSASYPYPGTVSLDLPYRGIEEDSNRYECYMKVDAMDRGASAILILNWGALTPIDVSPTLNLDTDAVSLIAGNTQTVAARLLSAGGYSPVTWSSNNPGVATVDASSGLITAVGAGSCTVTATSAPTGQGTVLTKSVSVTVAAAGSTAVQVEDVQVASDGVVTAAITGDVLVTNGAGDGVETANNGAVTIDVTSDPADNTAGVEITAAKVIIPASAAAALTGKDIAIETDMGEVKLDGAAVTQIAAGLPSGSATLTVTEAAKPSGLDGAYAGYYDISLTNASGVTVVFNNGTATITVPCGDPSVKFAYHIADGKRVERQGVMYANGAATWTTNHFSLWALSANEYDDSTGGTNPGTNPGATDPGGFFLSDGNYYVNIALWKSESYGNDESMGNVAFKNNSRALVTVSNGTITTVQVATNPVDVTGIHSAIISFRVTGSTVTVLETEPMTTLPAGGNYNYVKRVQFAMPSYAQPSIRSEVTYVNVGFEVPDTPMDAVFDPGEPIDARLRFVWSSATATSDTSLTADSSAASGTVSSDVLAAPSASLSDSATGIKLTAQAGVIPTDAELTVKAITSGADFTKAETAVNEALATEETPKFKLYDISLIRSKVAIQPNGTVTVSIPIPSDYDKTKVIVYRINDDSTATLIKGKVSGDNYEIALSRLSLYALVEGTEVVNDLTASGDIDRFIDVTGHWAYDAIKFAVENGLFNGTTDTTFSPNAAMNRGMFVTVLGRMEGIDASGYANAAFSDTA